MSEENSRLITKRLILRSWEETDAADLYHYAKDPRIGPVAGWPVHTSVENSLTIIETTLAAPETYAICLKQDSRAIGNISLMIGAKSDLALPETEGEIGFWIGVPFWGQGLVPEAVREMIRHAFEDLALEKLWCGYFDGNENSKRVQEKMHFTYHHTRENERWERLGVIRTQHVTCLSKASWKA